MSDKEYGLEDVCVALDGIETQLKRIIALEKIYAKTRLLPNQIVEVDQI